MTRRIKWIFALFAVLAAFDVAALATLMIVRPPPGAAISWRGGSTGTPDIGGPFTLMATDGRMVTDQTYRGKWLAVFFGYTSCPDACPTALSNMGVALEKLGKDAGKIQPLFITVDPDRDTSQVMSDFLESFDHRIVGLSGTRAQIDAAAKAYRAFYQLHKEQGDTYTVDHSAYFYLMDPNGKFADVVEGTTPGGQMADKIGKLIATVHLRSETVRTIYAALVLALGLLGVGSAVAESNQIVVEKAWARATPKMAVTGGGYLTVTNHGPGEDRLLEVTSPVAEKIQFHAMAIDNGVAKMTRLLAIDLHPGIPVVFKTGGIHMMLLGLKHQLKEGETVPLTLTFEKADAIEVDARVLGIGATGDAGNQAGSGN